MAFPGQTLCRTLNVQLVFTVSKMVARLLQPAASRRIPNETGSGLRTVPIHHTVRAHRLMIAKVLFACLFVAAGISHYRYTGFYLRIMPPLLPQPRLLVLASGAAELLLGLLLLFPASTRLAAWGLVVLLIAVFPANVFMTMHPERFPRIPEWLLWVRLPLQGVLIAWAWRYTKP